MNKIHENKTQSGKMLILGRIKDHYDFKTDADLAAFLGINRSTLSNWYKRNSVDYDLIFLKCEQLDKNWLITGKEEISVMEDSLRNIISRPFIDTYASCGGPNGFNSAVMRSDCQLISIPFMDDYDFAIPASGDSMINRRNPLKSIRDKDIVACKFWKSRSHIRWGNVYALATTEGVIIKQLQPSAQPDHISCVPFNVEDGFSSYDLPLSEIDDWAIVVGVAGIVIWQ